MVKTLTAPEEYQNKTISCRQNFTLFTAISLKQCLAINSTMAIKHIFYPIVLPAYSTEILLVYQYFPYIAHTMQKTIVLHQNLVD